MCCAFVCCPQCGMGQAFHIYFDMHRLLFCPHSGYVCITNSSHYGYMFLYVSTNHVHDFLVPVKGEIGCVSPRVYLCIAVALSSRL